MASSTSTAPSSTRIASTDVRVFEPHKVGLPPMRQYLRDMWDRRSFANELSRAEMRAAQTTTFFGRLWLVINPLLLALVYFLLVGILSGGKLTAVQFAHLLVTLFAFYFVSNCITGGAASVIKGSKLVMNQAFPRALLPMSAVRTAFRRRGSGIPNEFAMSVLTSRRAARLFGGADVVVPVDALSTRAAWLLARREPRPDVIVTFQAAERVIAQRRAEGAFDTE